MTTSAHPATELHFHALHGVDDGPESLDESVDLLRAAAADGTGTVVATPHVRGDFLTDVWQAHDGVLELTEALTSAAVNVRVRPGAELGHDMVGRLSQTELDAVAQGPPGARWLLVEAPFVAIDETFHAATEELRDRGFSVIVAHPERSADAALDGSAGLRRELAAGSLAQVNAQSVCGGHGRDAHQAALALIAEGLVSVISSDAHGPSRPPLLREARARLIEEGFDPRVGFALTQGGPGRLLRRGILRDALVA